MFITLRFDTSHTISPEKYVTPMLSRHWASGGQPYLCPRHFSDEFTYILAAIHICYTLLTRLITSDWYVNISLPTCSLNVDSMLAHRLRRWPNIEPPL